MAKLTLTDIVTGYGSAAAINANNALIETALENTLSRDGTTPNTMSADIDLNSNDLLNAGTVTATELTVNGISVAANAAAAAASAAAAATSETNAATSETNASTSETNAAADEALANQWSSEAEDVLVSGGDYSAFHWAQKAMAIVGGVAGLVSSNDTTADYLLNKFTALHGLTWTEINDGGNEDLQISVGDHLEIGGSANNFALNVYKADSTDSLAHFSNLTTGNGATDGLIVGINSSEQAQFWNYENTAMVFANNNAQVMAISSGGNVNIGGSHDTQKLMVHGSNAYLHYTNAATGVTTSDGLLVGIDPAGVSYLIQKENLDMNFHTNNSLSLRIEADGSLKTSSTRKIYDAAPPTGWEQGSMPVIDDDLGVNATGFDIDANITTWESVGPTGSSATNIWTAMDDMPSDAKFVILKVDMEVEVTTNTALGFISLYGRVTGSATGTTNSKIARVALTNQSGLSEYDANITPVILPVDSSGRFDLQYTETGTIASRSVKMHLVGWL